MPDSRPPTEQLRAERRAARERGEFVGFLACPHGTGRIVKVAMSSARDRIRAACPHCGEDHETAAAMSRPRRRGEECAVTLPDEDPTAKPAGVRRLAYISDADFLAAVPADDTAAQVVAKTLGVTIGSASGSEVRARAEWLNYDAGETRVIITRQGAPKPVLLRRAT
jgi:hypothetical protein